MDLDDLEDEFEAELAAQERMSKRRAFENDLLRLQFDGLYEPAAPDDPKDKLCGRCGHKRREHWVEYEACEGTTLTIDFNCDASMSVRNVKATHPVTPSRSRCS